MISMLRLFDYVYYTICVFYDKNRGSSPGVTALLIIAMLQFFNLFTLLFLIEIILSQKISINNLTIVTCGLLLLVWNGFRYNKFNYDILKEKWKNETTTQKKKKKNYVLFYLILSVVSVFALAIYVGSKK